MSTPPDDKEKRRTRISTDIESALEENNQVAQRVRHMLDSEELMTVQFDELHKAILEAIEQHHPNGGTLCGKCMKVRVILANF